jgi:hypothetical protein
VNQNHFNGTVRIEISRKTRVVNQDYGRTRWLKKKTTMAGGASHGGFRTSGQRPKEGGWPLSGLAAAGDGPKTRQRRDQSPMKRRWRCECGISREFRYQKHYK